MSENIDWSNLGFGYMDTDCHVRYVWSEGEWDQGELVSEPYLNMHIAATALHYGQTAFEGGKAFRCKDGRVRLFRPRENAKRLATTASRICMAEVPESLYMEAVLRVVRNNLDYVPPYGMNGSLYIRPLLIGTGAEIGVKPADEYIFMVMVLPVGAYYKDGLTPVRAVVLDDYDRAAPLGVGHVKIGGNYGASLLPHIEAQKAGYAVELYLDAKKHRFVEEFGTSNLIAVTEDGKYVTSSSASVLPSITNRGLQQIARDIGMTVEVRPIEYSELREFSEIAACGTAVVITPVSEITRGDETIRTGPRDRCGPVLQKLYNRYRAIQNGEASDRYGWMVEV